MDKLLSRFTSEEEIGVLKEVLKDFEYFDYYNYDDVKFKLQTLETLQNLQELEIDATLKIKINQYELSDLVHSRVREILELSKKEINLLTKDEISYIIVTGGTTEIEGFNSVLKEVFGKNIKTSLISNY